MKRRRAALLVLINTGCRAHSQTPPTKSRSARSVYLFLRSRNSRCALSLLLRGPLGSAGSRHDIDDVHVAFAAGVLEEGSLGRSQGNDGRPWFGPSRGIVNRKTILNLIGGDALEALGDLQSFGIGVPKGSFRPGISRLHHQWVAFPMTA